LLVDWLIKTLLRRRRRPILLLFDEIQELAVSTDGVNIVSALRAAITKSKKSVRVIFTGSNQERFIIYFRNREPLCTRERALFHFRNLAAIF
jgi:hypothetical protein